MSRPLRWSSTALLGGFAATALAFPAVACEPAEASTDPAPLPPPWKAALDELLGATAVPGQPWACQGGQLRVELLDGGAVLRVERRGAEPMARHVDAPADLVPMGKAMLALPAPAPALTTEPAPQAALPTRIDPSPVPPPRPPPPLPPEAPSRPRLLVDAVGLLRYQGAVEALSAGGGARLSVPIERWMPAVWVRYTGLVADLRGTELELSELGVGASVGFALLEEPVRLTVGVHGSLALIDMEAEGVETGADELEVDLRAVDGRAGSELRLSVPIVRVGGVSVGAVVALDAEVAPASLVDADRRIAELLPPLPSYGFGLSAGLEVVIP